MIINTIGRHNLTITEGMKNSAIEKLSFLNKFLKEDTSVNLTVSTEKDFTNIEVLFTYDNQLIKHEVKENDFYIGMDRLAEVLKNTISKNHDIKVDRNKKKVGLVPELIIDNDEKEEVKGKIVKRKNFSMKPMMEEEAILQMKMLGHTSFMFLNAEADFTICLLYLRKDGNYGIIESASIDEEEEE